jgi:hypothetical protein
MADGIEVKIDYQPIGRTGKVRLTARLPDGTTHTDKVDVADATGRERFISGLCNGRNGIDREKAMAALEHIAAELVQESPEGEQSSGAKPSQADQLVALAKGVELFHTPGGHDSEGYATVEVNGHKENWRINSNGFRRWLAKVFFDRYQKAPGAQALQDALNVLAGKAIYEGPEHAVAVRFAEHEGAIYLDLVDDHWRTVQITPHGWTVVSDTPVKFVRKRGMLPLPEPVGGGRLDELRALVNLPDDDAWMLYVAWLVAACRPGRPFPVLVVNGEQGSAKSTLCKMARALIDPNLASLRRPPREDRVLLIAATNGWIVAFDNLSGIAPALSDALCLLATGGGFGTRELYTDDEEKLFDAMRPIMLNGIEDLATRADLLDRALNLTLPVIPDDKRQDESELWKQFDESRPRILGALLDAVSAALKNLPNVRLASKPRMADFALWIVAAEAALRWKRGAFLTAYNRNRGQANELALESAVISAPVLSLMNGRDLWSGTAGEMLKELEARHTDDQTRKRKEWPTGPRKLSGDLRRLAPNLRRVGINVVFDKKSSGKRRVFQLERTGKTPSLQSSTSRDSEDVEHDAERNIGRDRPEEISTFFSTLARCADRDRVLRGHS